LIADEGDEGVKLKTGTAEDEVAYGKKNEVGFSLGCEVFCQETEEE
jgi:hypothetical protein